MTKMSESGWGERIRTKIIKGLIDLKDFLSK
jgi:hypothetical protein